MIELEKTRSHWQVSGLFSAVDSLMVLEGPLTTGIQREKNVWELFECSFIVEF